MHWASPTRRSPPSRTGPSPTPSTTRSAVLAYADCLTAGDGRTPLEVIDKLKTFWSDEEIFEFTYITTLYAMHAVITRALRMEYDNRPEAIVEVAAPKGFEAQDFLNPATPPKGR